MFSIHHANARRLQIASATGWMTNFCALHPQISPKNAEFPYLHLRNPRHLRIKQMPCQFCPVVCLVHNRTFLPGLGKNCTTNLPVTGKIRVIRLICG
jgi:hypothetical protein